jgi:DNA-binding CsgD family transcriptional regulator
MKDLKQLYLDYFEVLELQKFHEQYLDNKIVDKHIEFLKQLDLIENSSISVFDLNKKEHIFVSSNFSKMLGYNLDEVEEQGSEYFNSKVHPEDFLYNLENGIKLLNFSFLVPLNERKDYKLISDYRVKNGGGDYIRIIEQQQALELDSKGNFWLALSTVDISPDQDLAAGVRSRIFNFRKGQLVDFPFSSINNTRGKILSKREHEILKLVKEGFPSKEIAEKLFISVHTTNTHRQRILEKLNVANSYEAIQYASDLGLLN